MVWQYCILALVQMLFSASLEAGPLMLGTCEPTEDPLSTKGQQELGAAACLRGAVGAESTAFVEAPGDANWISYGSAYGGAFVRSWLSMHVLGRWRDIRSLSRKLEYSRSHFTDFAVLQIGNPAIDRYRVTAGRMRLPFGIDTSQAPQFYQDKENRGFWRSPTDGGYLTFDDLRRLRFDAGLAVSKISRLDPKSRQPHTDAAEKAISVRAALDVSALEGTRIVASVYGAEMGERRYGLGLINTNQKGDYTAFEFARRQIFSSGRLRPFEQLLRLAYTSAWQRNARWVMQFDDERLRFRRIVFDYERVILPHLNSKLAISYLRATDGSRVSRWAFTCGVETTL